METCTRLVNGITPQPHNTCTLSRGWWDIRAFTDCYVDYNIFCSWMVLLLVYQMTKRIINQWNNWIIITIIWEPPWTVCDEAEPCNFLLFEVTICHDPVYHPHTSCHLMTPGYCLTSVRQSAAPQQHWRPLWLLIRYRYSPYHQSHQSLGKPDFSFCVFKI